MFNLACYVLNSRERWHIYKWQVKLHIYGFFVIVHCRSLVFTVLFFDLTWLFLFCCNAHFSSYFCEILKKNKHYFFTLTSFFVWDERLSKFHIQWTLRYPGASVSGRFFLGTYFLSLFCLIYPEFRVPDPDGLFLTFPYEWKILV